MPDRTTERTPERLSPAEYEEVTQLAGQLRRFMETAQGVVTRLRPARMSSARGRVRSRLECVLHDFIAPALRDLSSIAGAAARNLEDDAAPR